MNKTVLEYMLYDGMNTEGQLHRVRKDSTVRFILDGSLVGKNVRFFTNYPDLRDPVFQRFSYRELQLVNPTASKNSLDCFDDYFQLPKTSVCGAFHFYFSKNGGSPPPPTDGLNPGVAGSGYLIVDPSFTSKHQSDSEENTWDLTGVVLQSYISKSLGYFDEWDSRLMSAKEANYNMVHFTPLQELGYSHSAYSLRDQLKVNPNFTRPTSGKPIDWNDIEKYVKHLEQDWSIFSMTDLVFNHTSNDSPWILEHPECAYNVINSPHLSPAYILDFIVWNMTIKASAGELVHHGIPPTLRKPDTELPAIRTWLEHEVNEAKLYEFFIADVDQVLKEFTYWLMSGKSSYDNLSFESHAKHLFLKIAGPREGLRFGATVDFLVARQEFVGVKDPALPMTDKVAEAAAQRLKVRLHELNKAKVEEVRNHLSVAINNTIANVYYRFYDPNGLKLDTVTEDTPMMWKYFYYPIPCMKNVREAEQVLRTREAPKIMAFNGWVMNDDPLRNFAEPESFVYLRRELIVWGDSVKLRYGKQPSDCPYLWDRMTKYSELTARIFHAVRLDNCHSTPLHVAQYMLDKARAIRPNLYVVAELFTGGEYVDNIFINKLGLNSLIRESLSSNDCNDLGRQVHRYGALRPAGAFFDRPGSRRLYPTVAHAVLYDQTHDNPSVLEKHCIFDYLPLAAVASSGWCAVGSTRGYDELVPHHINVVTEERMYAMWPNQVNEKTGLMSAKAIINEIHHWLSYQGFVETFVDQVTATIIAVTRFCPETREAVMIVAHTAFSDPGPNPKHQGFKPIQLGGKVNRILYEMYTIFGGPQPANANFKKDPSFINGLKNVQYKISQNLHPDQSSMFNVHPFKDEHGVVVDQLTFFNFPPGSAVAVSIKPNDKQQNAVSDLHSIMSSQFSCRLYQPRLSHSIGKGNNAYVPLTLPGTQSTLEVNYLRTIISSLNLIDLNKALFRCGAEEIADGLGRNCFDIPGWGPLVYCGFQSIVAIMENIRDQNDLGHPICGNLRQGDWLPHFLASRLMDKPKNSEHFLSPYLAKLGETVQTIYHPLSELPRYLVPAFFEVITSSLCTLLQTEVVLRMAPWIRQSSSLVQRLAVATNQFYGFIGNCRLPGPMIPTREGATGPIFCSLSAGLPHFAEGMWRCWGRDTFISLRGCLLLTGRFEEAASIILSYASLLQNGLIPNLTGDGYNVKPRYNCRDAVWYWLYSIVCYEETLRNPDSRGSGLADTILEEKDKQVSLLNKPIWRWFIGDSQSGWPEDYGIARAVRSSQRIHALHEVMQDALQAHVTGIDFVEYNAGPSLDEHMKPEGFHVQACIDTTTGFPYGGNAYNCGTWMDKMGSSEKAGNRGIPATPRDGSAVELVGLAYAVISWLDKMHHADKEGSYFPHTGVQLPSGQFMTWNDWANKLKSNFEDRFWIPDFTNDPSLAYNRGIYRDSCGSSSGYTDNQLRPNFLVTMVVAPDLFTPVRAWKALEIVRERLVGPLGMRTLSKDDLAYRGNYDNSNDSNDFAVARGFNYHQGPEWLWPTGFYIRARLKFARILAKMDPNNKNLIDSVHSECQNWLARLDGALRSSPWRSLPELTNADGQYCKDSCSAQAWTIGCIFEAVHDLINQF